MRYKNFLLTGGAGFIGSFLAERLVVEDCNVVIIDDLSRGVMKNLDSVFDKIVFYNIDLSDFDKITEVSNIIEQHNIEIVVHYAAVNGTLHFYDNAMRTAYVNSVATVNLLRAIEAAKLSTVKQVAFASTSEVYGEPNQIPTPESALTYSRIEETRDSYSVAKQMSEFYVKLWCEELGLKYNLLRIFNVYGPRMVNNKYGQVVPEFIKRINDGEYPLVMIGDGNQTRSFCYIDDHIEMVVRVLNSETYDNEVINIGNDSEVTIKELARKLQSLHGLSQNLITSDPRPGDINRRCPDITFFQKNNADFEFTPLEVGLLKSIKYYRC